MSALGTLLGLAALGIASAGAHRGLFRRSRRPEPAQPETDRLIQLKAEDVIGRCQSPHLRPFRRHWRPLPQTDESRRWHLERAEARRIRRAYRKMRHDIDSRLDNPAWKHSATGRSA